jgi:hypothetical protein
MDTIRNVGALVTGAAGIVPQSSVAATVTGSAITKGDAQSAVLFGFTGAATGTPTTTSVTYKVQDCATSGGTYADFATASAAIGASATSTTNVNLAGAKAYLKVVATVAFTGGSTPAVQLCAALVLGGKSVLPSA